MPTMPNLPDIAGVDNDISDDEHSSQADQFGSFFNGCVWPSNSFTSDPFAFWVGVEQIHNTGAQVLRYCPSKCEWHNKLCTNWRHVSTYHCIQRMYNGKKFNFWTRNPDKYRTRDVFYAGHKHTTPRTFGLSLLCQPELIITNPVTVCGEVPQIPSKFAPKTIWNADFTSIICLGGTQPKKTVLNMKCHKKRKWKNPQWVHQRESGQIEKLSNILKAKCKYFECCMYGVRSKWTVRGGWTSPKRRTVVQSDSTVLSYENGRWRSQIYIFSVLCK